MVTLTQSLYQCINDEIDAIVNYGTVKNLQSENPVEQISRLDTQVYCLLADGAELPFFRQNFAQVSATIKTVAETLTTLPLNPDLTPSVIDRLKSVQKIWFDLRKDINRADTDLRSQPTAAAVPLPLPLREQLNQLELEIKKLVLIKKI